MKKVLIYLLLTMAYLPSAAFADDDDDKVGRVGKEIFLNDTYGNEAFWGDKARLHELIAGISPATALELGLKVDVEALPDWLQDALAGKNDTTFDVTEPGNTVPLLALDAVMGLKGFFNEACDSSDWDSVNDMKFANCELESVGITCSACHSVSDDSFAPGIGYRLNGGPNRYLQLGKILSLLPDVSYWTELLGEDESKLRGRFESWAPGTFNTFLTVDGKEGTVVIPSLIGIAGSSQMGWNDYGGYTGWMARTIVLLLHGKGNYADGRLGEAMVCKDDGTAPSNCNATDREPQFPVAKANGWGRVVKKVAPEDDQVTPKLAVLKAYIDTLKAREAPKWFYNQEAADRGEVLFEQRCTGCHFKGVWTRVGYNAVAPEAICMNKDNDDDGINDDSHAHRSPNHRYKIPVLQEIHNRGRFYYDDTTEPVFEDVDLTTHTHPEEGAPHAHRNGPVPHSHPPRFEGQFFHDGRFKTVKEVVNHFNDCFKSKPWWDELSEEEVNDLAEYVKSL